MEIREDVWLSGIFGHGVFRIDLASADAGENPDASHVRDPICRHASQQATAMYYTKVDTAQIDLVRQLSLAGLYVVDVNVSLGIDTQRLPELPDSQGPAVCEIRPEHSQDVLEIARTSFRYSRFHLDPLIPTTTADQIKHDWILNYIRKKRGERLFVALVDDQPAGFLAALASDSSGVRVRTIDLIAVSQAHQSRGVGKALVAFFVNYYKNQCHHLQVGTQVANAPSLRLYQKLGFSIRRSAYVMHMHV